MKNDFWLFCAISRCLNSHEVETKEEEEDSVIIKELKPQTHKSYRHLIRDGVQFFRLYNTITSQNSSEADSDMYEYEYTVYVQLNEFHNFIHT